MKNSMWMSIMVVLCALPGCGGEDSVNECERAADVRQAGLDQGCEGRSEECWHCHCYNQGMVVKVEVVSGKAVYSCAPVDAPEPCVDDPATADVDECACEGKALTKAQECLADKEACRQVFVDMQDATCKNTPAP